MSRLGALDVVRHNLPYRMRGNLRIFSTFPNLVDLHLENATSLGLDKVTLHDALPVAHPLRSVHFRNSPGVPPREFSWEMLQHLSFMHAVNVENCKGLLLLEIALYVDLGSRWTFTSLTIDSAASLLQGTILGPISRE